MRPVVEIEERRKDILNYMAQMDEQAKDNNMYHHGPKPWASTELWLIDHGVDYDGHSQGYILEDKYIITPKGRWRVQGRNKWYWYGELPDLLKKVGVKYLEQQIGWASINQWRLLQKHYEAKSV